METAGSSETPIHTYHSTGCCTSPGSNLPSHCHRNFHYCRSPTNLYCLSSDRHKCFM